MRDFLKFLKLPLTRNKKRREKQKMKEEHHLFQHCCSCRGSTLSLVLRLGVEVIVRKTKQKRCLSSEKTKMPGKEYKKQRKFGKKPSKQSIQYICLGKLEGGTYSHGQDSRVQDPANRVVLVCSVQIYPLQFYMFYLGI